MGTANASDPLQRLGAAQKTAIADLSPELSDPASRAVRGVVTITWPYSSVKGTFAFILAEPDYRLRRSKGQVRINLTGASAKAAGESGLSSSDEVLVSLDGAEWVPEEVKKRQSLPGSGIDWQLKFSDKLLLQIHHPVDLPTQRVEAFTIPNTTPNTTRIARLKDGEFESPAFIKRARVSYGSLFEEGYDIFEDDGGVKGRGRKRTRFGRQSGAWKYSSQSPSPEPGSPQSAASSPPKPEMTDEGCQTMELDFPMPSPVQTSANTVEAHTDLKSTPTEEHVAHVRQGMVDHGIQGDFQNGWPVATSASLPPFSPSGGLPSSGSELPIFQPTVQFNAASNSFQQGWDPRSEDLQSEGYSHTTEPAPPNNFADAYGGERSAGLSVTRSGSRTRSPSEPNNLALEPADHSFNDDLPAEEHSYSTSVVPPTTAYPPLDLESEEQTSSNPQEGRAHLDYPPSYLDDSGPFSEEAMDVEKSPLVPRSPAAADAGSSLWTTINNRPQASTTPHTDRLGSTEGESVDNAIAIDDSDSDNGPPPPTAAEDTVMEGHADMYEEAEVEDDVDAEYSDDDEPDYEADEIGGDYDTRNYTAPDDDEDDSHDEDLRSHDLEPEFDDGRSWEDEDGDEEEGSENLEYESDYEMDEKDEEPQQRPRPAPQSAPQIIDLISSSEDEGEDDETGQPQPPSRRIPDSTPQSQPKTSQTSPTSVANEVLGQGAYSESEEHDSVESEDNEEISDEEEGEEDESEEEEEEEAELVHSSERSESESLASEDEGLKEALEENEGVTQSPKDDDVAELLDASPQHKSTVLENSHANDYTVKQRLSPESSRTEHAIIPDEDGDDVMGDADTEQEEEETNAPQSAAEGLEILSRVIKNESDAISKAGESEKMQSDRVIETSSSEANAHQMERPQEPEKQAEPESPDGREDEEPVDMVPTLPSGSSNLQPMAVDEDKRLDIIAPSSPPLTHSFVSQHPDEERMDVILHETVTITHTHVPADQLLTPRDTQRTGETTVIDSTTTISMEIDELDVVVPEESNESIVQEVSSATGQLVNEESLVVVEEAIIGIEEQPVEPAAPQRQQTPLREDDGEATRSDHPLVSPSLSFRTQVGAEDMTQASFTESPSKTAIEAEAAVDVHSDTDADASGASVSFISQMELDEELQASILENSQEFEEDANMEGADEHGIDEQSENREDEDRVESETQSRPASRAPSPELGTQESERRQRQETISVVEQGDIPNQVSEIDPSIQLARAANASKRNAKQYDTTKNARVEGKKLPVVEITTSPVEDSSVQLARASLNKSFQTEEEGSSMTAAKLKLVRHLRDELPDYTSLKVLRQYLQKKLDVIAVAMMQPPDPQRAKGGPREYMMSFTITDHSIGPHSVVEVQLYRPHKETLPIVKAGDVVLLHNFTVVSLQNKGFGLRTNDESSWAIFDYDDQPPQIKGPPVEYGEKETTYVANMRSWFSLLDEKARAKLERANQKIVNAGKSK
ncbi:hypothetical protein M434DRAFT_396286 [Hypoxylon sp. CO27-5]|nr:hypothetical protein M434DRAFT_396286 [Hypoxylon sp. CO27-5]